jgi:proline iminopeptidase
VPEPIPPPPRSGITSTSLYWASYGPAGASRLLVLHGGPGAHHDYLLPQMLRLAKTRELIFYDQRGGGRSRSDDRAPVTWQTNVGDLASVIAELGLAPLSLVGYSWGGLLALLYAVEAARGHVPVSPERMGLIDPAPVTRAYRQRFEAELARRQHSPEILALRTELAASGLRERDPDAYRQRTFELSVAGYFADPRRAHDLTPFRVLGRVQQQVWESLGDYDLTRDLEEVRCPALVVHGGDDPIPLESSEFVARALGARLTILDGSGHVPYVEQPEALFGAIEQFLDETEPILRR